MKKEIPKGVPLFREGPKPPLTGVWGCPPDTIFTPFLVRKGVRGMFRRVFQHPARSTAVRTLHMILLGLLDGIANEERGLFYYREMHKKSLT